VASKTTTNETQDLADEQFSIECINACRFGDGSTISIASTPEAPLGHRRQQDMVGAGRRDRQAKMGHQEAFEKEQKIERSRTAAKVPKTHYEELPFACNGTLGKR
jgi:hypothetical protein